jgi:hypothetical protein
MECARCGGIFHIEENHCPHCGVNIYEPDDGLHPKDDALSNVKNALRFPFAIFAGWLITTFIGLLLYIPIRIAQTTEISQISTAIIATLTLSLGAFAGSFIYQRIEQGKSVFGILSQILFSALLGILVFLTEKNLWTAPAMTGLLVISATSFLGIKTADKMLRKAMINDLFAPVVESQKRYEDLLVKVGHDREVAEHLIEHERSITPKATRKLLIENAIQRWERDNRI